MQALDPEQDGRTAAIIQENFDKEINIARPGPRPCLPASSKSSGVTRMHLCNTSLQSLGAWASEGAVGQRQHLEESVPHTLGQGGYKLAIPKWEKIEQDLLDRGIQPATMNWPERSRTWFYGTGEAWTH